MKIQNLLNRLCLASTLPLTWFVSPAISSPSSPYQALPGLIDIRTSFSDSIHSMEEIVTMAFFGADMEPFTHHSQLVMLIAATGRIKI